MGSKADFFEGAVLNLATGQAVGLTGITGTITPYLALFTGTLTGDSPGSEVTGGSYARVSTVGKWAAPVIGASTTCSNNATITFVTATGSWSGGAPMTHFGIFDALTGGNPLYYGDLSDITKTVSTGDTITFASGALVLTEG